MPVYEYRCEKCGDFEITQKITDKPLAKCPTCKSKVKKLISHTSFQLKGTGWYVTDYARKGQNGDAKKADSKSEGKSETKSESKTETKSESKKSESSSSSAPSSTSSTASSS